MIHSACCRFAGREKEKHMLLTTRTKAIRHWTVFTVCSILLTVVLAACGGGSTARSTSTPPPKPTPSPTSTSNSQTYTGDGYTIDYPSGWQTTSPAAGQVIFVDPSSGAALRINVVDDTVAQTAHPIVPPTLHQFQSQYTTSHTI